MPRTLLEETQRTSSRASPWLVLWLLIQAALAVLLVGISIGAGQWRSTTCVTALVLLIIGSAIGAGLWLMDGHRLVRRQRQFRQFRQLAHGAPAPLAMTDLQGRLVFVNEKWGDLFRMADGPATQATQPWDMGRIEFGRPERCQEILRETLRGGFNDQVRVQMPNGAVRRMVLATSVVRDQHLPIALAWSLHDVTETVEASEDLRRLAAITAHSADAVICTDPEGVITSWNEGATRIFGYTRAEAVGRNIDMLVPEDLRHSHREAMKARMQERGLIENIETVRVHKDGTKIPVHLIITNLVDEEGRPIGRGMTLRDVSKQRELEQLLRRQMAQLEDDLKHVHRALQDATRRHADLVPHVRDCLVLALGDSKVEQVNAAVHELLGYSDKEVKVMKLADFHNRTNGRVLNDLIGEARRNGSAQGDLEVQSRDGRNHEAHVHLAYYPELDRYQVLYRLAE